MLQFFLCGAPRKLIHVKEVYMGGVVPILMCWSLPGVSSASLTGQSLKECLFIMARTPPSLEPALECTQSQLESVNSVEEVQGVS